MQLVLYPEIESLRLEQIRQAAGEMNVINAHSQEEALAAMPSADAFYGKMTPELLAAAGPQLRWVQSPTASLEHYLFPELMAHPCIVTNMRGLFSDVIADHVFGYILCFARNLHRYLRFQQEHRWAPIGGENARLTYSQGPGLVTEIDRQHLHLSDCTIGVVGAGAISAETCHRTTALGMDIIGEDPKATTVPDVLEEIWPPERLPDLLAESDFVVIAAPHTPQTERLFRSEQFAQMKSSAYLINIGRGVIVDLKDLTEALQTGQIAGAGLDVFEIEPLPEDHSLWDMEQVIITPHIAASSTHVAERHLATLLQNVANFATGQPLLNVVDKQIWC